MSRMRRTVAVAAAVAVAGMVLACGAGGGDEAAAPEVVNPSVSSSAKAGGKQVSSEVANATRAAKDYLKFSAFSRKGLIHQLSADAGSGFSEEASTTAVDSLKVNWNEQAVKSAQAYLKLQGMSRKGLIHQLESDNGAGFTHAQAVYGADKAL